MGRDPVQEGVKFPLRQFAAALQVGLVARICKRQVRPVGSEFHVGFQSTFRALSSPGLCLRAAAFAPGSGIVGGDPSKICCSKRPVSGLEWYQTDRSGLLFQALSESWFLPRPLRFPLAGSSG